MGLPNDIRNTGNRYNTVVGELRAMSPEWFDWTERWNSQSFSSVDQVYLDDLSRSGDYDAGDVASVSAWTAAGAGEVIEWLDQNPMPDEKATRLFRRCAELASDLRDFAYRIEREDREVKSPRSLVSGSMLTLRSLMSWERLIRRLTHVRDQLNGG